MKYFKTPRHMFFSKFLWQVRNARGLSQAKMAEQLHISSRALSNLETGKSLPGNETLLYLEMLLTQKERETMREGVLQCMEEEER